MATMVTLSDEELVARCKLELPGDTRSYEVLVQRHMQRVFSLVYRIVCNREEAEDITQEVFVKVYNGLKKYDQQAAFSTWLYRVATNAALDALDKIKRRPQAATPSRRPDGAEALDPLGSQPSPLAGPEDSSIQNELRNCISNVLKKMDRDQARMLVMRDFEDLSYDEIANSLGAGLSAVKMRIHRARLAFQERFSQLCGRIYLNFAPAGPSNKTGSNKLETK
ncbi:MAG TPA: sigma-70 family RNA polymerase sigma factor [Chloroflexia bacterium]|nr:sigma-70 family RNA polymerase sigma factor [Chloroflexia bacterium]